MGYQGPAVIVTNDGGELTAAVSLSVRTSGHMKSWQGHGSLAPVDAMRLASELGNQRLRLPNGKEGVIVVSNTSFSSSATKAEIEILGSGPPPF